MSQETEVLTKQLTDQTILLSEIMIKLNAIEQLLKTKNVFTAQELEDQVKQVVAQFSEAMKVIIAASEPPSSSLPNKQLS